MGIVTRVGAGELGMIVAVGFYDAVAIKIPATHVVERHLTIAASYLPQAAAIETMYGRLAIWAGQDPNDGDIIALDALSTYLGLVPGRVLLDTQLHVKQPFFREMTLAVEPTEDIWCYMPYARDANTLAAVAGHVLLSVVRRESDVQGTQGLKAV